MPHEPSLFDDHGRDDEGHPHPRELSRREDPATSHLATHQIAAEGTLGRMMKQALEALRDSPGSTASELDPRGVGSIIAKRLNDLRKAQLATIGDPRRCRVTGRMAQTWWPR